MSKIRTWRLNRPERFGEIAAEFIFTVGAGIAAAKQATSVIPMFALSNVALEDESSS
jgi:hypothetical protein